MTQLVAPYRIEFTCLDKQVEDYLEFSPTKITLCGSTRFFLDYAEVNRMLTFLGWTVLSCGSFGHSFHKGYDNDTPLERIKALHFWKIEQADAIVVINSRLHLGKSTQIELEFAKQRGKSIINFHGNNNGNGYFEGVHLKPRQLPTLDDFLTSNTWQSFATDHPGFY